MNPDPNPRTRFEKFIIISIGLLLYTFATILLAKLLNEW